MIDKVVVIILMYLSELEASSLSQFHPLIFQRKFLPNPSASSLQSSLNLSTSSIIPKLSQCHRLNSRLILSTQKSQFLIYDIKTNQNLPPLSISKQPQSKILPIPNTPCFLQFYDPDLTRGHQSHSTNIINLLTKQSHNLNFNFKGRIQQSVFLKDNLFALSHKDFHAELLLVEIDNLEGNQSDKQHVTYHFKCKRAKNKLKLMYKRIQPFQHNKILTVVQQLIYPQFTHYVAIQDLTTQKIETKIVCNNGYEADVKRYSNNIVLIGERRDLMVFDTRVGKHTQRVEGFHRWRQDIEAMGENKVLVLDRDGVWMVEMRMIKKRSVFEGKWFNRITLMDERRVVVSKAQGEEGLVVLED